MRKTVIVFSVALAVATGLVIADYLELFGTNTLVRQDFIELRFSMIDEKSGVPVIDAHAKCFQKYNQNACSQRNSGKLGIVSIQVPVKKLVTKTFLFEKNARLQKTRDPKLQVLFFHPDYASPVETIMIPDLPELSGRTMTVPMPETVRNQ